MTSNPPATRRHFLRRLVFLLAGGLPLASLSGCGRGESRSPASVPTNKFPPKPGQKPTKPGG
jgi:hypothetical protein